jgi:hypothetical protein
MPDASLYERCGHMPFLEHAEQFNSEVLCGWRPVRKFVWQQSEADVMEGTYVGKPYRIREDGRILTGKRRLDMKRSDTCSCPGAGCP